MRRAARVDDNQGGLVDALRAQGFWVRSTAGVGSGFPDLLVWGRHTGFVLLEVKSLTQVPSKRRLTALEQAFIRTCPGPVHVVHTLEEALEALRRKA